MQEKHTVQYSDGDVELLSLFNETWQLGASPPTSKATLDVYPLPRPSPVSSQVAPAAPMQQQPPCAVTEASAPSDPHAAGASSGTIAPNAQPNGTTPASAQMPSQPVGPAIKPENAETDGQLPATAAQAALHQGDTGICLQSSGNQNTGLLHGAGSCVPSAPGHLPHLQSNTMTDGHEAALWHHPLKAEEGVTAATNGSQAQISGMPESSMAFCICAMEWAPTLKTLKRLCVRKTRGVSCAILAIAGDPASFPESPQLPQPNTHGQLEFRLSAETLRQMQALWQSLQSCIAHLCLSSRNFRDFHLCLQLRLRIVRNPIEPAERLVSCNHTVKRDPVRHICDACDIGVLQTAVHAHVQPRQVGLKLANTPALFLQTDALMTTCLQSEIFLYAHSGAQARKYTAVEKSHKQAATGCAAPRSICMHA